jgi:hypothetical protein
MSVKLICFCDMVLSQFPQPGAERKTSHRLFSENVNSKTLQFDISAQLVFAQNSGD